MNADTIINSNKHMRCVLAIPPTFNEEFLLWFRSRTESGWKTVPVFDPETVNDNDDLCEKWHPDWRGARWLEPLSDEEINAAEEQWQITFPPDYRLFFKWLHATDRPGWENFPGEQYTGLFYNWQKGPAAIRDAYEHILGGFAFDAIHNAAWHSEWGTAPLTEEEAHERLKPIVDAAPKLIPIHIHRYLLAEPCQVGNPVLSIWQSDIIVIAPDLRTYLLRQWSRFFKDGSSLLHLTTHDQKMVNEEVKRLIKARQQIYKAIPFWGNYLFFGP